jgi:hypothetical protein
MTMTIQEEVHLWMALADSAVSAPAMAFLRAAILIKKIVRWLFWFWNIRF